VAGSIGHESSIYVVLSRTCAYRPTAGPQLMKEKIRHVSNSILCAVLVYCNVSHVTDVVTGALMIAVIIITVETVAKREIEISGICQCSIVIRCIVPSFSTDCST